MLPTMHLGLGSELNHNCKTSVRWGAPCVGGFCWNFQARSSSCFKKTACAKSVMTRQRRERRMHDARLRSSLRALNFGVTEMKGRTIPNIAKRPRTGSWKQLD